MKPYARVYEDKTLEEIIRERIRFDMQELRFFDEQMTKEQFHDIRHEIVVLNALLATAGKRTVRIESQFPKFMDALRGKK